jgi:fatty-acyl-CoA synthase
VAEEIRAQVKERKGPVHTPKHVEFVGALPLTPLGKPDKKTLRKGYWQGHDRAV